METKEKDLKTIAPEEQKDKRLNKNKRKFYDKCIYLYLEIIIIILIGQVIGKLIIGLSEGLLSAFIPSIGKYDVWITGSMYISFIGIWIIAFLDIRLCKNNRPILKVLSSKTKRNIFGQLLIGIVIGFFMNGICILAAWLHKDIAISFDALHPISLIFIFATVFVQSSAEEFICRGFLYQKLLKSYKKPMCAIIVNSLLFALLHLLNSGITILSFFNILLVGILMSLFVYYDNHLWCAFAIHTAWNFMQNILFGLPNSGLIVPYSVFKLDTNTSVNSFFYDVGFGIEGTVMANVVLLIACVVMYLWGKNYGKKIQ